ncbi:MAG: hypothetical protein HYT94_04180 [Parcubacteria group bacterium]|nr:hypothetical protein [Parcubacteria group bacterium]
MKKILFGLIFLALPFNAFALTANILVVGGGGVGGTSGGGGGGGGGYQSNTSFTVTPQEYSVTVGAGGSGVDGNGDGNNGGDSIFGSITAIGGGGGATNEYPTAGKDGGSGGGGSFRVSGLSSGGTGSQGSNGGGGTSLNNFSIGGGGGGAGAVGGDGSAFTGNGGNGGDGTYNSISGSFTAYGGGGGGGIDTRTGGVSGNGGAGGGGGLNTPGTPNTGGGGSGGTHDGEGNIVAYGGGSGVVIISVVRADFSGYTITGGTKTTDGANDVYTFTSNGTWTLSTSTPTITGSGTANRLAKFITGTSIGNALFSDDGIDTTLTSGNLFLQIGSAIDSVANGVLNFGTTLATTMNFGRTGQKMIINSDVGIGTAIPTQKLDVNGGIFSNFLHLLAGGLGIDTDTAGVLSIGATNANSIQIGHTGMTTMVPGTLSVGKMGTVANCNSSASPAICDGAPAGSVALGAGDTTLTVNTSAVTPDSQIFVTEDSSLGTRLGVTCNTAINRNYRISARTPGASFTIRSNSAPAQTQACLSYWVVN